MQEPPKGLEVKISDDELKGRNSNLLRISHTREEFVLDFINLLPPQGVVTARVVGERVELAGGRQHRLQRHPEREQTQRQEPQPWLAVMRMCAEHVCRVPAGPLLHNFSG